MPHRLTLAFAILGASASLAWAQVPVPLPVAAPATTPLKAPDGKTIGEAAFNPGNKGVLIEVKVTGLSPGWHGMHLHTIGDCSDAKFEKAGGHLNHTDEHKMAHGLLNPNGPDFGDLPSIFVAADGAGQAQVFTTRVALSNTEQDGQMALQDKDGSSLVIHAAPDDQKSQPIGGAGDRVACGIIK